ncbi:hypothetical protein Z043_106471, partial [Scleropages formosus]
MGRSGWKREVIGARTENDVLLPYLFCAHEDILTWIASRGMAAGRLCRDSLSHAWLHEPQSSTLALCMHRFDWGLRNASAPTFRSSRAMTVGLNMWVN